MARASAGRRAARAGSSLPTDESGTRHRSAERRYRPGAGDRGVAVMNIITVYADGVQHAEGFGGILQANQALGVERYRSRLDAEAEGCCGGLSGTRRRRRSWACCGCRSCCGGRRSRCRGTWWRWGRTGISWTCSCASWWRTPRRIRACFCTTTWSPRRGFPTRPTWTPLWPASPICRTRICWGPGRWRRCWVIRRMPRRWASASIRAGTARRVRACSIR